MSEEIKTGLLKERTLSARIYFLLLNKPLTQSEISKEIYNGRVQLSNINKNIKDLEEEGYVNKIGRRIGLGRNYNKIYYSSNLDPLFDFIKKRVGERKSSSKSKAKELVTSKDLKFLRVFLQSKWFKRFYSQKYMNADLECEGKVNKRFCSCPIRFLARLLEEIFVITQNFAAYGINFNNENFDLKDFDKYLTENTNKITPNSRTTIANIVNNAKKTLGSYPSTNLTLDFYFYQYGVLFLPYSLSKKLSSIGRIPLTISIHFNEALKEEID